MGRLSFTYSLEINSNLIKRKGIEHEFFIAYGEISVDWRLHVHHNFSKKRPFGPEISEFSLFPSWDSELPIKFHECSCNFILKQSDSCDLSYLATAEKEKNSLSFDVPQNNAISKYFEKFLLSPKGMTAVLVLILEFPKNVFFTRNWPTEVKITPVGWENDKRFQFLTIGDKHNFHIICTDGILYARKRDFVKNSEYFKKKFKSEWKGVSEIKVDISQETMKIVVSYLTMKTLLEPKEMNRQTFEEIYAADRKFGLGFWKTLEIMTTYHLGEASLDLHSLVSWCKFVFPLARTAVELRLAKNYYTEIVTHYQEDATFTDSAKKKTHKILHEQTCCCQTERSTLFARLNETHEMSRKVLVTEVTKKK